MLTHRSSVIVSSSAWSAVYVECRDGITAYVEELPGVQAFGGSIEEAELAIREALELAIAANRRATWECFRSARVVQRKPLVVTTKRRSVRGCPSMSAKPVTSAHSN